MISTIFFRFWRVLSMPFLAITLLICYFNMPDMVAVQHTESGRPNSFMDKQNFFYTIAVIFVVFNFLMNLLKNQVQKIDFAKLNPKSNWAKNKEQLNETLIVWFDAFVAIVNTFMVFVLIGVNRINRNEEQRLDINYNWVLLVGAVLLIALFFYLPIKLLYTNPEKQD